MHVTSEYFPYAVVFDRRGEARLFKGNGKADYHAALLRRHDLIGCLDASPGDFVMGRCRVFAEQKVLLVDTASDLFFGKTGRESPLDGLSPVHVRRFEVALMSTAPRGWRVFVLNAGMALRVPGVTAQKLAILLDRQAGQAPGVIREIGLTPPPSGETT